MLVFLCALTIPILLCLCAAALGMMLRSRTPELVYLLSLIHLFSYAVPVSLPLVLRNEAANLSPFAQAALDVLTWFWIVDLGAAFVALAYAIIKPQTDASVDMVGETYRELKRIRSERK